MTGTDPPATAPALPGGPVIRALDVDAGAGVAAIAAVAEAVAGA